MPVLLLSLGNNEYILNTTERFIRINDSGTESLFYSDLARHNGYKDYGGGRPDISKVVNIKSEGHLAEFGLRKKGGQIIYWSIPTGSPGFAFWNVTNKFEIIGRRYLISSK